MKIQNDNGFTIQLTGKTDKITDDHITELKQINPTIYFQETEFYYWIFDFKIGGLWFEMLHENTFPKVLKLNVYQ